jgi:hypothetical protein
MMRPAPRLAPLIVWLVVLLGGPTHALAYRPFTTEDAAVAGEGVWQLEAGWDHLRWRDDRREHALLLVPIYGLTPNLEVGLEMPFRILERDERDTVAGVGDVALGAKLLVVDEQTVMPAVALRGTVKTPSGSERRELGSGTWDLTGVVAATKTVEPLTLHAMLGYTVVADHRDDRRNVYLFGAALDWAVARGWHLAAEVVGTGQTERGAGPDPINAMLGFMYEITETVVLDVSTRYGLNESVPRWTVGAGLTVTF